MNKVLQITMIMLALIGLSFNSNGQKIVFDEPSAILHLGESDDAYGFGQIISKGNFNNDSYEDLVVIAPNWVNGSTQKVGKAYIYYGSTNGISQTPSLEIEGSFSANNSAIQSTVSGDFNNDGYDDLALASPLLVSGRK